MPIDCFEIWFSVSNSIRVVVYDLMCIADAIAITVTAIETVTQQHKQQQQQQKSIEH